MVQITKENGMQSAGVPFAWVEVQYPDKAQWDETGFYDMVEQHVAALREQYREYVRADVFGQNPYFRYFRKFKKTYPVMMQFESVLLKGREFPRWTAVTAVPFLTELETHVLCGTHDVDCLMGPVELYQAEEKTPFEGLRGDEVHTYPGDVTGRDAGGIIFSMIAGADERTCAREESCSTPSSACPDRHPTHCAARRRAWRNTQRSSRRMRRSRVNGSEKRRPELPAAAGLW